MKLSPKVVYPLLVIVGVGIGLGGIVLVQQFAKPRPTTTVTTPSTDQITIPTNSAVLQIPGAQTSSSYTGFTGDVNYVTPTSSDATNPSSGFIYPADETSSTLDVVWAKPVRKYPKDLLMPAFEAMSGKLDATSQQNIKTYIEQLDQVDHIGYVNSGGYATTTIGTWELGTVNSGPYQGSKIYYRHNSDYSDPGGTDVFHFLVSADGKEIRLIDPLYGVGYSGETQPSLDVGENLWKKFVIPAFSLHLPTRSNEIVYEPTGRALTTTTWGARTDIYLSLDGNYVSAYEDWLEHGGQFTLAKAIGTTKDGRTVYAASSDNGCVFIQDVDGFPIKYRSMIPSKTNASGREIALVTLTNASAKKSEYSFFAGGCDGFCPWLVPDAEMPSMNDLVVIGKTKDGDDVFGPKDPATNQVVKDAYDTYYVADGMKPSFEKFLIEKPIPVFFWKDGFGRWVKYTETSILPQAECGKPVIYLYPPKTENISVRLPSFISVTKSEPTYPQQGWNVVAQPSGDLTMKDGSSYGSLYWEGTGVSYNAPKQGFIVKDGEVSAFLKSTLAKYGLNEKESQEFRDFWVPKMTGAAYYRVSFLTNEWSQAAPLLVSPQPATSIRIFMDWQKLNAPISIEEPKIVTPSRNGFTLVEWGGLLYN